MAGIRHRGFIRGRFVLTAKRAEPQADATRSALEGEIDQLVYQLSPAGMIYGLTEDEVKIVEGK